MRAAHRTVETVGRDLPRVAFYLREFRPAEFNSIVDLYASSQNPVYQATVAMVASRETPYQRRSDT